MVAIVIITCVPIMVYWGVHVARLIAQQYQHPPNASGSRGTLAGILIMCHRSVANPA